MRKNVTQVRDLILIEHGLENNFAGVLSFNNGEEKVLHLPLSFVYLDKNIYLFFPPDDEIYSELPYNTSAVFTTIKSEKGEKVSTIEFKPKYRFFSVTIKGILKKVDEVKIIEDIKSRYLDKYSSRTEPKENPSFLKKLVMIDTEEIQATEEIGG